MSSSSSHPGSQILAAKEAFGLLQVRKRAKERTDENRTGNGFEIMLYINILAVLGKRNCFWSLPQYTSPICIGENGLAGHNSSVSPVVGLFVVIDLSNPLTYP